MNMGAVPQTDALQTSSPPTPDSPSPPRDARPPMVHSISQHYHHSSHLALLPAQTSLDMSDLPDESPEEILRRNGIDPSSLYPSQLTLFQNAALEQKARLIELWRISPSSVRSAGDRQPTGHPHNQTTRPAALGPQDEEMMEEDHFDHYEHAEPYVLSGYEQMAQREYELSAKRAQEAAQGSAYKPSNDPVYKGHDFWQQSSTLQQSMENQYGAHEMRSMYFGCGVRRPHWLDDSEML
ncbi:hypothetical protein VTO42DRAFT_2433 [Malbranchea cinnamomea]